jgi:molecular chaperone GrpE
MVERNDKNNDEMIEDEEETLPMDDVEVEVEEAGMKDKLRQLREKLAACDEEKRKHLEDLQRVRADFLNSKRRLEEQLERDKERAADKILMELLTLVDSFDTATADKALWDTIDPTWRTGMEAIKSKLDSILKNNHVEAIDPTGLPFNPAEHEAVSDTKVEDERLVDTVITVLQKGFKRNGMVIRPARVVVGTK